MGLTVAELEQALVSQSTAHTGLLAEIVDARGTAGTLGARLDVALNTDGTLRTSATAAAFVTEVAPIIAYPPAGEYVALKGDLTAVYVAKRRLRINGALLPYVTSSTYDAGGDYTVVNFSTPVGYPITSVEYSFDPAAMPPIHYSGNPDIEQVVSGISTFATKHLSDAQYKSLLDDILSRVTITSLASVDDGAGVDLVGRAFKYVDTIDDLRTLTPTDAPVYIQGHTTNGDGGHGSFRWDATSTAADDNGVTIAVTGVATGRWIRQLNGFVIPEMFGGLSALAAYAPLSVILNSKVYVLFNDITFPDPISKFIGQGYGRLGGVFDGSVITGEGGFIFAASALQHGLSLADFALVYTGVGTALKISNILNSHIRNVFLDLNSFGDTGIDYSGDATYFSILENSTITSFKGTGVKLNSNGTKGVIRDCNIGSAQETAVASVEVNVPGAEIIGGQLNIDRTDGLGVGVLFNNISGATHQGGLVDSVLSERDTLVKITGTTHGWTNVVIRNTRHTMGQTSTAVIFDRAIECTLDNPSLYGPTANYLAEFTANAIRCGIIGGYEVCRANLIVDAGAVGSWKRCVTPILYAYRANITVYPNLITTVDDCQYLGKTIHNGTSWDKFSVSIPDDSFATFVPPELFGTMEISSTTGGGDYILANYNVQVGACSQIAVASSSVVNASNGTLTGTTGADGQLTVRCSSDGNVYVENRRGGSRRIIIHFKSPGPNA